jgi:hypothetical protein
MTGFRGQRTEEIKIANLITKLIFQKSTFLTYVFSDGLHEYLRSDRNGSDKLSQTQCQNLKR